MLIILHLPINTVAAGQTGGNESSEITLSNWINHPEIRAVREIYKEIKRGLEEGSLKARRVSYDYMSDKCSMTYPFKWQEITFDENRLTRLFRFSQIISHGETMNMERYYDRNGQLRFVLILFEVSGTERIYLNSKGDVIFSVKEMDKKYMQTDYPYEKGDFPVNPSRSDDLYDSFIKLENPPCPILK